MAIQTFNDGDPIDASIIQGLVTEVNSLRSTIPQIGTPTPFNPGTNTGGGTTPVVNIPQIFGGITGEVSLTPGEYKTFQIDYSAAKLTSNPKAIILTPRASSGVRSINQASILSGSISATGATGQVYHRSDATAVKVKYYFMVIAF